MLAAAADRSPHALSVVDAWSRPTPPGVSVGVAYFGIANSGAADTLVAIESPAAERVEVHSTTVVGGLMEMRPSAAVEIPAGGRIVFEPNGLHAMLIGLKHPLKEGERIALTLVFRRSGPVSAEAVVRGADAKTPPTSELGAAGPAPGFRLTVWPPRARSPDFKLVDFDGRPRTLKDYRGRVLVIFFGYLRCPDACPAELFKLAQVMKELGRVSDHILVLFVTLDPQRDTPALLKSYVTGFDARFIGLSGAPAQTDEAAANFHVDYAQIRAGADYTVDHSTSTFLIDGRGRLRLVGAMSSSIGDLVHDLRALAAEQ
jgi:protein SCO1/2